MDIKDIYIISVNGGLPKRLTQMDKKRFSFTYPRWSPDGKKIAFRSLDYEGWEKGQEREPVGLCIMNADGGSLGSSLKNSITGGFTGPPMARISSPP
jgi:Tol biopolymer transport system component